MEKDKSKPVGICGLYCGTCPYYLAPRKKDTALLSELSQEKDIPVEQLYCDGCLSDRISQHCIDCRHGFRDCAREHGVTRCFECEDFPCSRLASFRDVHIVNGISHHATVIEDLEFMKTNGLDAWIKIQEEKARCPACGATRYWHDRVCRGCGCMLCPEEV